MPANLRVPYRTTFSRGPAAIASRPRRPRPVTALLAVVTIALGLASRRWAAELPAFVAAYAGDALWAAMIFWLAALVRPAASTARLAAVALFICVAVELSQLYHAPWIDGIRATRLGGLILGYDFLASDLACYAAGVALAAAIDRLLVRAPRWNPVTAPALLLLLLAGCVRDADDRAAGEPRPSVDTLATGAGLIASALASPTVRWVSLDSRQFRLYAVDGSHAAGQLPALGVAAERARAHALGLLGVEDYPRRIALLFLPSREMMRDFVGWPAGGWGVAAENGAFFVATDSLRPALRHELMHVLSWNLWGTPSGGEVAGQWISEGLATYAAGCQGASLHTLAAGYEPAGTLVAWPELATRFDARTFVSNVQSASVVEYVRERFGPAAVHRLWKGGLSGLEVVSGEPVATTEAAWRRLLREAPPLAGGETVTAFAERIRREGCER